MRFRVDLSSLQLSGSQFKRPKISKRGIYMIHRLWNIFLGFLVILLCLPSNLALAQDGSGVFSCDSDQTSGWRFNSGARTVNGVCELQRGSMYYSEDLRDFRFRFRLKLDAKGYLVLRTSADMSHWFEVAITPTTANLTRFQGFGNASSTVRDTLLASAEIALPTGEWMEVEWSLNGKQASLMINGQPILNHEIGRMVSNILLEGKTTASVDDLQFEAEDLTTSGETLETYAPELLQTWIAYRGEDNSLWLVHPDGSGRVQVAEGSSPDGYLQFLFSPDGKLLLISDRENTQSEISFLDLTNFQMLSGGISWGETLLVDWLPDSQKVVLAEGDYGSTHSLRLFDVQSGGELRQISIPNQVDTTGFILDRVDRIAAAPNSEEVYLRLGGKINNEFAYRNILLDLNTEALTLLPWSGEFTWSPDGSRLYTTAGGLIDLATFTFQDLPANMVEASDLFSSQARWSPNGQFITGKFMDIRQNVLDLFSNTVLSTHLAERPEWAPDSQHLVASDFGRIIVQHIFGERQIQIGLGSNPIWQPMPQIAQASQAVSQATPTPVVIFTAEATALPLEIEKATSTSLPVAPTTSEPPRARAGGIDSRLPELLALLGLLGLVASLAIYFFGRHIICTSCKKANPKGSAYCMYCGSQLQKPINTGFVAGSVVVVSLILMAAGGIYALKPTDSQPEEGMTLLPTAKSQTRSVVTPTFNQQAEKQSTEKIQCGAADISNASLRELLLAYSDEANRFQALSTQVFSLMETQTATGNTPNAPLSTQSASLMEDFYKVCRLALISFSSDNSSLYVLLSDQENKVWNAVYRLSDAQLIWIKPAEQSPSKITWSPDSARIALEVQNKTFVIDSYNGKLLAKIEASTRQGSTCRLNSSAQLIHWMEDSQRIVRKIDNGIQVLDSASGAVLQEIPVDDNRLGSVNQDGRPTCGYSFDWSPDGSRLVSIGTFPVREKPGNNSSLQYYPMRLWDTLSMNLIQEIQLSASMIPGVLWSPDGQKFLTRSYMGGLGQIFDAATLQPIGIVEVPGGSERGAFTSWSPDSKWIALKDEGRVYLYQVATATWKPDAIVLGDTYVNSLTWLPNSQGFLFESSMLLSSYGIYDLESNQTFQLMNYLERGW